jgi:pyrroloquinoline quinone (PQQ) biosynthesis protein C
MTVEKIIKAWKPSAEDMLRSPAMEATTKGLISKTQYMGYLKESYHHAGWNPQIQAYAALRFPKEQRDLIGKYFAHARSEIGHDLLALQDYVNLGGKAKDITSSRPLPSTAALNGYIIGKITFESPLHYLGYLFHLEFMPTQYGVSFLKGLLKAGISENAITFLKEHHEVDEAHNKLFAQYVEELIKSDDDLKIVQAAAQDTCFLHSRMVNDAYNVAT